jgi:protein-S-isoprenylcysteine O-methyltransferase Ste14
MSSPLTDPSDTAAAGRQAAPFSRVQLEQGPRRHLSEGRWANAVLYRFEQGGAPWVVKDFGSRSWLVRNVIGRFLVRREVAGLRRVSDIPAAPRGAFRIDAYALAYRFVPGTSLRTAKQTVLDPEFFPALERSLLQMHAASRLAHLDLRNAHNILVTDTGAPALLDFQSYVGTRWLPPPLRRFLERIDLAAIYKHWAKRSPDTLGAERAAALDRMNRLRPLWVLRGYIGHAMLDAIHRLFNHPALRRILVKSRVPLALAAVAGIVWLMDPAWLLPGFLVSMFGEAIQLWCFASLDKGRTLACNGPYAMVRNPMYLGRFFIILGCVMLLGRGWLMALYTAAYYFYMVNRVHREEEFLRGALGAPYEEYLRTVNRFLPGAPLPGNPVAFWDWQLLKQNHGPANLAGTLAFWAAALLWLRYGRG